MFRLAIMMFPFVLPWSDGSPSFTNLSDYFHKPAGQYGFITSEQGHLFAGNKRIRFVGMNFSFSANLPASRHDAEVIAARLAKYGINCVRMTLLDKDPAPNGILNSDMRTLNAAAMNRLDYFVSQLKRNGIYILMQLHVARTYPGINNDPGTPLYHNGVDNYFDKAVTLQKEYAADLLNHLNPYTDKKYAEEPAIAFVEINNENALTAKWWQGDIDKLPGVFRESLEDKWNTWLSEHYKNDTALKSAWQVEPAGADILKNSKFTQALDHWQLLQSHGSSAVVERTPDGPRGTWAAKIQIRKPGAKDYGVQLFQEKVHVKRALSYTLEFDAKSDTPRQIAAVLIQTEPFKTLYLANDITLSAEWKRYAVVFTPTESSTRARFSFTRLATAPGAVWIANVSLKPGGAVGLAGGERLRGVSVVTKKEFHRRARRVQTDWLQFLADTEERYWSEMYRYLREDLNVKSLVIGTQQNYSPYFVQQGMDVIDMHGYWDQQSKLGENLFQMKNKSQVGDPYAGVIGSIASRRIHGRPFIVSEYNYRGANTHASEADLLMLAYASLQDWDGLFIFNYANNNLFNVDRMIGDNGFNGHSNRFVSLVPAALLFHRNDVRASDNPIVVSVSRDLLLNKMRVAGPAPGTYEFGLDIKQPLRTGVSLKIAEQPDTATMRPPKFVDSRNAIISDTGELTWDPGSGDGQGIFTINTRRTKAIIGFVREKPYSLGGVVIRPGKTMQGWAAITLTAMDGADSVLSGNVLLTATGNSENTNMMFSADRTRYTWGKRPVLVEGVQASIVLPVAAAATRVWALDETGNPEDRVPVADYEGKALIKIESWYRTLWYKIEILAPSGNASMGFSGEQEKF